MNLALSLSLTGARRAGDPYASAIAAYDLARAGSYTENTGRIDSMADFSPNGYTLIQDTAGERPVIGALTDGKVGATFTTTREWLYSDASALANLVATASSMDFSITIVHEQLVLGTNQALVSWTDPATAVNEMYIGPNAINRLRIERENGTPTKNTTDSATAPYSSTGVTYVTTVTFSGGLVNAWVNGSQIITDTAFAAGTPTLAATRFVIGARAQNVVSLGHEGLIHSVVIEAN